MKAIWKDTVIAESDNTIRSQSNDYFPLESIKKEFFLNSDSTKMDPYRGPFTFFNVVVSGDTNKDAAWYFTEAKGANKNVNNHVAFDKTKGIVVE